MYSELALWRGNRYGESFRTLIFDFRFFDRPPSFILPRTRGRKEVGEYLHIIAAVI
jgi:hypothetical protein